MRRWIQAAAKFYPASWRARYSDEFAALLEDCDPGWREFADVLRGAVNMQMKNTALYWKLAAAMAVAGAIAALAISLNEPRVYESSAVVQLTPPDSRRPVDKETFQGQAGRQFGEIQDELLSRTNLERLITAPGLDLYRAERSELPMEDIVQQMQRHDIRIQPVSDGTAFQISYSSSDQAAAQAVVKSLVTEFTEQNLAQDREQARTWEAIWPHVPAPPGMNMSVLDPPSRARMTNASPVPLVAAGIGLGLLLGLVIAAAIRSPKWTLHMACFAAGCCGLAFAASYLVPERYTSTAVLRLDPALVTADPDGEPANPSIAGKLGLLEDSILSRTDLEYLITSAPLDLYAGQRRIRPMEDVVNMMRKDVTVERLKPSNSTFRIRFTYDDRYKAQAVVREIVTRFTEENITLERQLARDSGNAKLEEIADHRFGENLEIIEPPSDPQEPVGLGRLGIAIAGFGAGLVVGAWALYFRMRDGALLPKRDGASQPV